jgi:hypothetical protein
VEESLLSAHTWRGFDLQHRKDKDFTVYAALHPNSNFLTFVSKLVRAVCHFSFPWKGQSLSLFSPFFKERVQFCFVLVCLN